MDHVDGDNLYLNIDVVFILSLVSFLTKDM